MGSEWIWIAIIIGIQQKLEQWLLGMRGAGEIDCKGAQGNLFCC